MRYYLLFFVFSSFRLLSQDCPETTGLHTGNHIINSNDYHISVEGHWDSMLGTGVDHFIINYKHVDSLQWNNLANLDSTSTNKIIPFLDFNSTYVWRVVSYCTENNQNPTYSVVDTFTTVDHNCPAPTNLFVNNIVSLQNNGFAQGNWDSMLGLGVHHFIIKFKEINENAWTNLSDMDSTTTSNIMGNLMPNNFYVWKIQSFCSENSSYFSDWSDVDTFYVEEFVPQPFTPEISIELSNLNCNEYTDITISTIQGQNEPDISDTKITSNFGTIDLDVLSINQIVGEAIITTGINNISDTLSLVIDEISIPNNLLEIDLVQDGVTEYSLPIINLESGIDIELISPFDGNSYTSGNQIVINLEGVFLNPILDTIQLQFDVNVNSELNDYIFNQFDFEIDCEINSIYNYTSSTLFFPNPSSSYVNLLSRNTSKINIYNIGGKLVDTIEYPKNSIDISHLSKGYYFLEIYQNDKISINRLIIN